MTVDDRHHGPIFVLGGVILGEVEARALKQTMSLQISRATVDRLLDASNSSVTLRKYTSSEHHGFEADKKLYG
jgi:hypothetical protein